MWPVKRQLSVLEFSVHLLATMGFLSQDVYTTLWWLETMRCSIHLWISSHLHYIYIIYLCYIIIMLWLWQGGVVPLLSPSIHLFWAVKLLQWPQEGSRPVCFENLTFACATWILSLLYNPLTSLWSLSHFCPAQKASSMLLIFWGRGVWRVLEAIGSWKLKQLGKDGQMIFFLNGIRS